MMKKLLFALGLLFASSSVFAMANPASVYCEEQWWDLQIENIKGWEMWVCYFEDNRQCEEWALFRGECPIGWVKVTGYVTTGARYCAILGWDYEITSAPDVEPEQWTCTLPSWETIDASALEGGWTQTDPMPADNCLWSDDWAANCAGSKDPRANCVGSDNLMENCSADMSCQTMDNLNIPQKYIDLVDAKFSKFQSKLTGLTVNEQLQKYKTLFDKAGNLIKTFEAKDNDKYQAIIDVLKYIKCLAGKAFMVSEPSVDGIREA